MPGGDGERAEVVLRGRCRAERRSRPARKCFCPLRSHCCRSVWKRVSSCCRDGRRCTARCRRPREAAGQKPYTPRAVSSLFDDDLVEQSPGVVEQLAGARRRRGVVEDLGILALQLPGQEERRPVDVRDQFLQRKVVEHADAGERRLVDLAPSPSRSETAGPGLRRSGTSVDLLPLLVRVDELPAAVRGSWLRRRLAHVGAQQPLDHAHAARGVEHVHGRVA